MLDKFLADGFERACDAIEKQVRVEVMAEYCDQLASVRFWQRALLNLTIERDIKHRMAERIKANAISRESLY